MSYDVSNNDRGSKTMNKAETYLYEIITLLHFNIVKLRMILSYEMVTYTIVD